MAEKKKKWAPLYPGWALSPPGWKEKGERKGWETRYTTVGARPRGARMHPFEVHASSPEYRRIWFGLSAVLVGVRPNQFELSTDAAYWVTLARKLLQRGTLPPTGTHEERDPPTPELLAWLFASNEKHPVDPAIDLHPVFEKPFFDALIKKQPSWASFVFPQAPFEALTVEGGSRTTRWVDFLFAPPTIKTEVVELDGSQHAFAQDVDAERDGALKEAGIEVRRVEGGKWDEFLHSLSKTSNPCSLSQEDVPEGETWREALLAARSVFGIIEAVANGFLEVGSDWQVELPSGVGNEEVFKELLALVVSVDELWTTKVVPKNIFILGPDEFRWQNRFGGVESTKTSSTVIKVDWAPNWAMLPNYETGIDVVVRGVPLPVHAGWDPALSSERRNIRRPEGSQTAEMDGLLGVVADHAFGIKQFRPGQSQAIRRVLEGKDSCVLLPTGYGKTLVFQVASLLRPGATLVVAPLKALIDDQERRFVEDGIDRVAAITSDRTNGVDMRTELHGAISRGNAIVAIGTPERLQIESFRTALESAAKENLVSLAVVDEAHCVSEWGHQFRTAYLRLGKNIRKYCRDEGGVPPPLLALTGTASPSVLRDVLRELQIDEADPQAVQRPDSYDRENLTYEVRTFDADPSSRIKMQTEVSETVLVCIPKELEFDVEEYAVATDQSGVIFVPHVNGDYGIRGFQKNLQDRFDAFDESVFYGEAVVEVFSGTAPFGEDESLFTEKKKQNAEKFRRNEVTALVATKAFGMGVDKPDVRWTVHAGFASSIEGFAQEAGRAGRDGGQSHCVVVSEQCDREVIEGLLDPNVNREKRHLEFLKQSKRGVKGQPVHPQDDALRQLFFHYGSFPGPDPMPVVENDGLGGVEKTLDRYWCRGERNQVAWMWKKLSGEPGFKSRSKAVIPQSPVDAVALAPQDENTVKTLHERTLFRLSILGVVKDVSVDYGAGELTVEFGDFTSQSVAKDFLTFANRILPGKSLRHQAMVDGSPSEINRRVAYLANAVVDLAYEVIERARINALREMWRLTLGQPDDERIRKTIVAYLDGGQIASTLGELVLETEVDVPRALRKVDLSPPANEFEWLGAAVRWMEAASHPLVLFVRAIGEAHQPMSTEVEKDVESKSNFVQYLKQALDAAEENEFSSTDFVDLLRWTRARLRNDFSGQRIRWVPVLWETFVALIDSQDFDDQARKVLHGPELESDEAEVLLALLAQKIEKNVRSIPTPTNRR